MKVIATTFISLCLLGSSVGFAETQPFNALMHSNAMAMESWTAGDHLGTAKRYEEEARLLQAEVRGMENVERKILPFLAVEAIKEAGVQTIIDRRLKEADENLKLAGWHHNKGMQMLAAKEAGLNSTNRIQTGGRTDVSHPTSSSENSSYQLYDWMEDELEFGG